MLDTTRSADSAPADGVLALAEGAEVGRYRVEHLLGRGGMGAVYAAYDTTLDRRVALKVISSASSGPRPTDGEAKARLLREARAAAALEHPNVVAIYDVGEHEGAPFFAMELVVGQTLRARMEAPATLVEKIAWLGEMAEALGAAHDLGIVHRDVKPENVMIKRDGHVKVLDFGIARRPAIAVDPRGPTAPSSTPTALGTLTAQGAIVGTPLYMPPEQIHGDALDGRCDQFAWGVVAYELFAGRPPWDVTDVIALLASIVGREPPPLVDVSPEVGAVVARALSKKPDGRFPSIREAAAALRGAPQLTGLSSARSTAVAWSGAARAWQRRALGFALALLVAAGASFGVTRVATSSHGAAAVAPSVSASAEAKRDGAVALTDLPLPHSDVAEALAAYKAGLQGFRDYDRFAASSNFARARKLDPSMGAAYLHGARVETNNDVEMAELYRQATERRGGLPEHEAELLDAVLPCAQGRAGADRWCVDRLRALAEKHPRDADFAAELAGRLNDAGQLAASRDAARHALELDPKFGRAYGIMILALEYLGEFDAADAAGDACMANSPSIYCLYARALEDMQRGRGAGLDATAHAILGLSENNLIGLNALVHAASCEGRPIATVRAAAERRTAAAPDEDRSFARAATGVEEATWRGDFAAARAFAEDAARAANLDMAHRAQATRALIAIGFESGRDADALIAARDYLDLRETLVGPRADDDRAVQVNAVAPMLLALRRAGAMTKAQALAERDRFIAMWRVRIGPDYQPFLWLQAYAVMAEDADDAREALDALPRFNGAPKWFPQVADLDVGRVYALAGRADEALPWLEQAAHACRYGDPHVVWANLALGKALEEKREKAKACEAYAFVLRRWGSAKPKSVTAEEAKRRSKGLGCPP